MENKIVILKLGGSLLSDSEEKIFDFQIAENLKKSLTPLTQEGYKFILSCGGGYVCRKYQKLLQEKGYNKESQHWVGVETCNLNATLMRIVLGELARPMIIALTELEEKNTIEFGEYRFIVAGAARPGHSSDMDAVIMAGRTNCNTIISLKNVDGVYTDDPKKNPNAQKIAKLTWHEYLNIIKTETHNPGAHFPVDPVASKKAMDENMEFIIVHGENLDNLVKAIKRDNFSGSIISDN